VTPFEELESILDRVTVALLRKQCKISDPSKASVQEQAAYYKALNAAIDRKNQG
jgi:hypothetical protein